jgi:hypothetical protein
VPQSFFIGGTSSEKANAAGKISNTAIKNIALISAP